MPAATYNYCLASVNIFTDIIILKMNNFIFSDNNRVHAVSGCSPFRSIVSVRSMKHSTQHQTTYTITSLHLHTHSIFFLSKYPTSFPLNPLFSSILSFSPSLQFQRGMGLIKALFVTRDRQFVTRT